MVATGGCASSRLSTHDALPFSPHPLPMCELAISKSSENVERLTMTSNSPQTVAEFVTARINALAADQGMSLSQIASTVGMRPRLLS